MSVKLIGVWIVGAVFLLAGTWIIQNLELTIGVSDIAYYLAMIIGFIFFLAAGLCWISVGVATKS